MTGINLTGKTIIKNLSSVNALTDSQLRTAMGHSVGTEGLVEVEKETGQGGWGAATRKRLFFSFAIFPSKHEPP